MTSYPIRLLPANRIRRLPPMDRLIRPVLQQQLDHVYSLQQKRVGN
jgi:hypothetical protein